MKRLDKFLSEAGVASRKELKAILRSGAVRVNGEVAKDGDRRVDETADCITLHGERVAASRTVVLMLHKPAGYVTSTEDPRDPTVMELIPEEYRRQKVMPVGRLDKATEGLLLLTNDGALAHRLISPKYEVEKVYYAEHEGAATQQDVQAFSAGLTLRDGTVCRSAALEILAPGRCHVTVTEGKYHQVRRMLASRGLPVTYLRREREGAVHLGQLPVGAVRELTPEEEKTLGCLQ